MLTSPTISTGRCSIERREILSFTLSLSHPLCFSVFCSSSLGSRCLLRSVSHDAYLLPRFVARQHRFSLLHPLVVVVVVDALTLKGDPRVESSRATAVSRFLARAGTYGDVRRKDYGDRNRNGEEVAAVDGCFVGRRSRDVEDRRVGTVGYFGE